MSSSSRPGLIAAAALGLAIALLGTLRVGSVSGLVVDEDLHPIQGAVVRIRATDQNAVSMTASARRTGRSISVEVTVTNDQTGHHVPTDSPLRQMILVVEAADESGSSLPLVSGPSLPEAAGVGDPQHGYFAGLPGELFARTLQEMWTEVAPTGAYWNPTRVLSDTRLAALASDVSRCEFAADEGRATIRIRLLFRRAFLTLMDQKDWDVPDILMEEWQGNVD